MRDQLSLKARLSYCVHLFKAMTRQHHLGLRPLLAKHIPNDGVVVDAGSHAGQFAKLFARLAPDGRVYAFEPGGYALSILRKVIAVHRLNNVVILPFGLGDQAETAILHMPVKKSASMGFGLSHLGAADTGKALRSETIALTTVDRFAQDNKLRRLDLVKADIEGWELRMLMGGRESLASFRPVLMLESERRFLLRAGDTPEDLMNFLSSLDYDVFAHDKEGSLSPVTPESTALFCIPRK
jgi:FkbM family methyltransferase